MRLVGGGICRKAHKTAVNCFTVEVKTQSKTWLRSNQMQSVSRQPSCP